MPTRCTTCTCVTDMVADSPRRPSKRPPSATSAMRFELFAKDNPSLVASARQLVNFGARGLNIPHKTKGATPLSALQALQTAGLPEEVLADCVPHYSLKYAYGGGGEAALRQFAIFCEAAAQLPGQQLALRVHCLLSATHALVRALVVVGLLHRARAPRYGSAIALCDHTTAFGTGERTR